VVREGQEREVVVGQVGQVAWEALVGRVTWGGVVTEEQVG
jgi:hypothetical protein